MAKNNSKITENKNIPVLRVAGSYLLRNSRQSFFDLCKPGPDRARPISFTSAVKLIKALHTLPSTDESTITEKDGGVLLENPAYSCFIEGMERKGLLNILSHACPFWVDALLFEYPHENRPGRMFSEPEESPCKGCSLELPPGFTPGKRGRIILDSGSWEFSEQGQGVYFRAKEGTKPIRVGFKSAELYLGSDGNLSPDSYLSRRKTDPMVTIFGLRGAGLAPMIAAITPISGKLIIRGSALPPGTKMGAILEVPRG
ncbi:hypothetical protein GF415_04475 [Candidatus Micrarchaeota archaeon]|nr:hypothetical protein [Candidatus Micrarchaeota archaeon]